MEKIFMTVGWVIGLLFIAIICFLLYTGGVKLVETIGLYAYFVFAVIGIGSILLIVIFVRKKLMYAERGKYVEK